MQYIVSTMDSSTELANVVDVAAWGLETPLLAVDLDRAESNIARAQRYCDAHGLRLRPHVKTHKLPLLAHKQLQAGATGIACQKLGEAEVMAAAGIDDILVTYPLIGERRLQRFVALAREHAMSTVVDSEVGARGLAAALERRGATAGVLVDCDTGFGRTGVPSPHDALRLAQLVDELPGTDYRGLMTYPTTAAAGDFLTETSELLRAAGLAPATVSTGGTPGMFATHELPAVDELRVGTYVFGDRACLADGTVPASGIALHVKATVVSRATADRAVLDAGSKTLSKDPAKGVDDGCFGLILEYPDARIAALSEEHARVDLSACTVRPSIGDVVTVIPNHVCVAVNLANDLALHRSGELLGVVPVAARGLVR